MMSFIREEYASASDWLSALKKGEEWTLYLKKLQHAAPGDMSRLRGDAMRRIGKGKTFEYWDIFSHNVELTVEKVWRIAELTLPKLEIQTVGMLSIEWLDQHAIDCPNVPEKLKSAEAGVLMGYLVEAGVLNGDWQPVRLSGSERALVAKAVCDRLDIKEVWQVFGQLWNEKPETLRSYLNKALEQRKSLDFQEKLRNILN